MPPYQGPEVARPILRGDFLDGVRSARINTGESRLVGAQEYRNFRPGMRPAQTEQDPSPVSMYDYESEKRGSTQPRGFRRVTLTLSPDTSIPYRSDGKSNPRMR